MLQGVSSKLQHQVYSAALHSLLGYSPVVVHCGATTLQDMWQDIQAVADALHASKKGAEVIASESMTT